MSTLILILPPRTRFAAQGRPNHVPTIAAQGEHGPSYEYLLSPDGVGIGAQGSRPASKLPAADTVIAVPDEADISWHRVLLPRANRAKLRAALAGMLEEALLDDPDNLHFALEPDASGGDSAWIAATSRAWLAGHLAHLEAAQVFVDRVAPSVWPDAPPHGHFSETASSAERTEELPIELRWSSPEGVTTLRLSGNLSRSLFPPSAVLGARWTATPAVIAPAERWLGTSVEVLTSAQRVLAAIDCPWNLRQFELAPRTRGFRALRQFSKGLMLRSWRPVRWGLAGLVLVQLLGLNLAAWQQRQQFEARRASMNQTLTSTYPQVRDIRDAPAQMQRETEALRASAGRAGDADLETLLAAAATAWPADRGPIDALSFDAGRLVLSANGWSNPQIDSFRTQLQSEGWQFDIKDTRMTLSRPARVRLSAQAAAAPQTSS
jgi:general secretion pathway protein L